MMAHPIIDRPDLQSWRRTFGYGAVTLCFWLLYLYLWQPLLSLIFWALGMGVAYLQMVELGGYQALLELVGTYGLVVLSMATVYIGWAQINYRRFRGQRRRREAPELHGEETARYFGVKMRDLANWQEQRMVVVHHGPEGEVAGVQSVLLFPCDSDTSSLDAANPYQVSDERSPARESAPGAASRV